MAKKATSVAADPIRIREIAGQIRAAAAPVTFSAQDNDTAKDNAKAASDTHRTTREGVFVVLADLALTGHWSQDEITAAAAKAKEISNAQDEKAIATFIGEAKAAMDPSVRGHVSDLVVLRDLVWTQEEDLKTADSNAATLFKDVFKRKQHMLTSMFNAVRDGRRLDTASDMVSFARDRAEEQRLDTDKIVKRIKKIQSDLNDIYRDYPEEDLGAAISSLESVSVKSLDAVKRDAVVSETTTVVDGDEPEEVIAEDCEVHHDEPAITSEEVESDPFDVLDELNLAA